jgi:hypothetical protein
VPFDPRVRGVVDAHRKTFESLGCLVDRAEPDFAPAEVTFRVPYPTRSRMFSRHGRRAPCPIEQHRGARRDYSKSVKRNPAPESARVTWARVAGSFLHPLRGYDPMTRMTRLDGAIAPVTVLCIVLLTAPLVLTQGRFQVESRDLVSQSGLVIYTIRDNQMSTCYTLFVVEPPPAIEATAAAPAPSNKVEEARAVRDEQLAALSVRVAARNASDRVMRAIEDEAARKKIHDEFDRAIRRAPRPTALPWAVPLPGMQTGEGQQAEAITRDLDPTSDRDAVAGASERLGGWLMRDPQGPRIAATGPLPCKPSVVNSPKP